MIPSSPFRPYFRIRIAFRVLVLLVLLGFCNALPLTTPLIHPKEKRSDVVCGAASWVDVVAFFLLNYVAHAATIRHFPGDSTKTQIWWTACALFVPFAGVWRGCQSIANARPFEKDALVRAKYAGALCIVTPESQRSLWDSLKAFRHRGCRIKGKVPTNADEAGFVRCLVSWHTGPALSRSVARLFEKIHGVSTGSLRVVPPSLKVVPNCRNTTRKVELSRSNSLLKCGTAVVQVAFACFTLYRTKSDQVEKYGYAAFGLTVIPYAVMSIINLTANLLTPEYPTLFMVQSDAIMHEMQEGPYCDFDGTVGTIVPQNVNSSDNGFHHLLSVREITEVRPGYRQAYVQIPEGYVGDSDGPFEVEFSEFGRHETIPTFDRTQRIRNLVAIAIGISALVTPYVLIAIFTNGFETGTMSTPLQRGFVMSWLVVGQVFGALSALRGHEDSSAGNIFWNIYWRRILENGDEFMLFLFFVLLPLLAGITPALGGFVVVGLMIKQFGSCVVV